MKTVLQILIEPSAYPASRDTRPRENYLTTRDMMMQGESL